MSGGRCTSCVVSTSRVEHSEHDSRTNTNNTTPRGHLAPLPHQQYQLVYGQPERSFTRSIEDSSMRLAVLSYFFSMRRISVISPGHVQSDSAFFGYRRHPLRWTSSACSIAQQIVVVDLLGSSCSVVLGRADGGVVGVIWHGHG